VKCFERSRKGRRLAKFAAKSRSAIIACLAHVSETPVHALAAVPLHLFALRLLCATTIASTAGFTSPSLFVQRCGCLSVRCVAFLNCGRQHNIRKYTPGGIPGRPLLA
jgi:hypothetical protein